MNPFVIKTCALLFLASPSFVKDLTDPLQAGQGHFVKTMKVLHTRGRLMYLRFLESRREDILKLSPDLRKKWIDSLLHYTRADFKNAVQQLTKNRIDSFDPQITLFKLENNEDQKFIPRGIRLGLLNLATRAYRNTIEENENRQGEIQGTHAMNTRNLPRLEAWNAAYHHEISEAARLIYEIAKSDDDVMEHLLTKIYDSILIHSPEIPSLSWLDLKILHLAFQDGVLSQSTHDVLSYPLFRFYFAAALTEFSQPSDWKQNLHGQFILQVLIEDLPKITTKFGPDFTKSLFLRDIVIQFLTMTEHSEHAKLLPAADKIKEHLGLSIKVSLGTKATDPNEIFLNNETIVLLMESISMIYGSLGLLNPAYTPPTEDILDLFRSIELLGMNIVQHDRFTTAAEVALGQSEPAQHPLSYLVSSAKTLSRLSATPFGFSSNISATTIPIAMLDRAKLLALIARDNQDNFETIDSTLRILLPQEQADEFMSILQETQVNEIRLAIANHFKRQRPALIE